MENPQLIEMLINKKQTEKQEIADKLNALKSDGKTKIVYSQEKQEFKQSEKNTPLCDDEIVVTEENLPTLN